MKNSKFGLGRLLFLFLILSPVLFFGFRLITFNSNNYLQAIESNKIGFLDHHDSLATLRKTLFWAHFLNFNKTQFLDHFNADWCLKYVMSGRSSLRFSHYTNEKEKSEECIRQQFLEYWYQSIFRFGDEFIGDRWCQKNNISRCYERKQGKAIQKKTLESFSKRISATQLTQRPLKPITINALFNGFGDIDFGDKKIQKTIHLININGYDLYTNPNNFFKLPYMKYFSYENTTKKNELAVVFVPKSSSQIPEGKHTKITYHEDGESLSFNGSEKIYSKNEILNFNNYVKGWDFIKGLEQNYAIFLGWKTEDEAKKFQNNYLMFNTKIIKTTEPLTYGIMLPLNSLSEI